MVSYTTGQGVFVPLLSMLFVLPRFFNIFNIFIMKKFRVIYLYKQKSGNWIETYCHKIAASEDDCKPAFDFPIFQFVRAEFMEEYHERPLRSNFSEVADFSDADSGL